MATTAFGASNQAAFDGDVQQCLKLTRRVPAAAAGSDYDGRTALHVAVCEGNLPIVQLLLRVQRRTLQSAAAGAAAAANAANANAAAAAKGRREQGAEPAEHGGELGAAIGAEAAGPWEARDR